MVWCMYMCSIELYCPLLSCLPLFAHNNVPGILFWRRPTMPLVAKVDWKVLRSCDTLFACLPVHSTGVGRAHEAPWTNQTKWTCCVCLPRSSCLNSSSHCREPRLIVEICQLLQELETASFLTDLACYGWMNSTVFLRTSPDPWTCSFLRGPNLKS